jgi:hypothetical protein
MPGFRHEIYQGAAEWPYSPEAFHRLVMASADKLVTLGKELGDLTFENHGNDILARFTGLGADITYHTLPEGCRITTCFNYVAGFDSGDGNDRTAKFRQYAGRIGSIVSLVLEAAEEMRQSNGKLNQ